MKKRFGDLLQYDVEEEIQRFKGYRAELAPLVVDQLPLLVSAQAAKLPILIEGMYNSVQSTPYPSAVFGSICIIFTK